jgi:hypothetical protein
MRRSTVLNLPLQLEFPGPNVINPFTLVIYEFCNKLECLSLCKPFQPSLMFVRKAGAYPSGAPNRSSHFRVDS